VQELAENAEVWGIALSRDGKRAVTGTKDKSLQLWDVDSGKQLGNFEGVKEDVRCMALSPDGKTLAVGHFREGATGTVRLWDVESRREIREFPGHRLEVSAVAFSPDGKRLVSSSFDKTVRVWEVTSGKELKRFVCASRLECATFADGGRRVLCAGDSADPTLQLWDVENGKRLLRSEAVPQGFLDIAPLPGGGRALTAGRDGMIRLWRWKK
jgi:WD40 repeat protein